MLHSDRPLSTACKLCGEVLHHRTCAVAEYMTKISILRETKISFFFPQMLLQVYEYLQTIRSHIQNQQKMSLTIFIILRFIDQKNE